MRGFCVASIGVSGTLLSPCHNAFRDGPQAASALVFGKEVTLQTHGKDKYGRTLADVILSDTTSTSPL